MRLMGAEPAVLPDAVRFLQITFLGFIFVFGFFVYVSLMRGMGVVGTPMMIVMVTVLLNLVLDPLFIFGWGPVPAMGVAGAAMATLFTQALATVIGFALLFRGRHGLKPRLPDFRPDFVVHRESLPTRPAFVDRAIDPGIEPYGDDDLGLELWHDCRRGVRHRHPDSDVRDHPRDGHGDGDHDAGGPEHRGGQNRSGGADHATWPALIAFFVPLGVGAR